MSDARANQSPALPGQYRSTEDDLDEAVETINHIVARKGLETALEVGQYLLDSFFGGDAEAFRQGADAHVSYRALAERDDLAVSYSWLSRAVGVVEQVKLLPEDVAYRLSLTHHYKLLAVRDEGVKRKLATEAAEQGLTRRDLERRIRQEKEAVRGKTNVGRPTLPAVMKAARKTRKLFDAVLDEGVKAEEFDRVSDEDFDALIEELDDSAARLRALTSQLDRLRRQRD